MKNIKKLLSAFIIIFAITSCKTNPKTSSSNLPVSNSVNCCSSSSSEIGSSTLQESSLNNSEDLTSSDISSSETISSTDKGLSVGENTDSGSWGPIHG